MRKFLLIALTLVLGYMQSSIGQTGCSILLKPVPVTLCPGNTLCVDYETVPPNQNLDNLKITLYRVPPGGTCQPTAPNKVAEANGNCILLAQTLAKGFYCVQLTSTNCGASNTRTFELDTLDTSPAPIVSIVQLPPIRPSYCPEDTVNFKVLSILNGSPSFTLSWFKNDTSQLGSIDSTFSSTGLIDGDYFSLQVTKQSKCAVFAAGISDSIRLKVSKNPKVRIVLKSGTGCEKTLNTFVAKPDTAGPNPTYIWTREYANKVDTLSSGVNDSTFTLTPTDSATFGSKICVELVDGRCKLKDKACFDILACGKVEIDPPLDTAACAGTIFRVPYTITGSFLTSNVFTVQLSDSLGNFTNPINVGTLVSNQIDTIRALIPANSLGGDCFKVRILATQPLDTSEVSSCIKIFPRPPAPLAVHDSVCKSGQVDLSVTSTLPNPTFVWYTGPFSITPVFTGNVLSLTISRDTVFYVEQLSASGCPSDRVAVRGISIPTPEVEVGPNRRLCVGDAAVTLNPSLPNGTWSGPFAIIGNVLDITGQGPGNYVFKYSVSNSFGCVGVDSFTLTINPIPVVNAGQDFTLCSNNQPILLTGTPVGGSWSGPSGIQSDGTFIPASSGPGTFNAIYNFSQDGCSGSDTAQITVNEAPPIFTISTTNPSACNVDDGTATLQGITTGPGFKVKWSVNRADSLSDPTISNLGAGTYTVFVLDSATGCRRFGAFGLSDPTAPTPVISGLAANYCSSDPCVTMGVAPNSPSGSFTGTGVVGNQFCPQLANLGPNFVVYSYDTTGGCTGTTSVVVRVNESPIVNAGPLSGDTICRSGGTYSITGFSPPAPPAVWSPANLISNAGVVNLALAATGQNNLVISRTLASCTSTDTFKLFVNDNPVISISRVPSSTVCQGSPVELTANITNGLTATFFQWFKDNVVIPNQNLQTLIATEPGSYTVRATTSSLCEGVSSPIVLNFNGLPQNGINPSGILQPCSNNLTTLTADSLSGYTFQWFGLDSIPGATKRIFTPNQTGQYRVRIRNVNGCIALSSIVDVNVLQAPTAPIVSPPFADTCLQAGQPITITVGATGGGLTFNWFRIGTPNQPQPGNSPSFTVTSPGAYFVEVLAANGCSTRSDTINARPTIQITAADTVFNICQGVNTQITGLSPTVGCTLFFNGAPVPNNLFGSLIPGEYTLTYVCTSANGCASRKNIKVVVAPAPQANFTALGATDVCQGDTVTLVINDGVNLSGEAYELLIGGVSTGTVFTNPIIKVTTPGVYTVRVTRFGCAKLSNQRIVTFKRRPRANAGSDIISCSPLNTELNASAITPGNWSGSPRVVTSGAYGSGNFIGIDTLTLTVDSANGCSNTDTRIVEIRPNPDFDIITKDASACLTSNGSARVVDAPASGFEYRWYKVGTSDTLSTLDSLTGALPGAYQVKVTNINSGCTSTFPAIINSPNNLEVQVAGLPDSICANGSPVLLTGVPTGGDVTGVFTSLSNRIVGNPQTFDPSLPGLAIDTVYYTSTVNGCVGTGKKAIKINPIPVVDAGANQQVCFGDTIVLKAIQPVGVNLIWIGNQVEQDSLYIATDPGITSGIVTVGYTLNGCSNTDSKTVTINPLPQFTLNTTNVTLCGAADGSASRDILNPASFQTTWRNVQSGQIVGVGAQVNNLAVGIYSVLVRNSSTGCTSLETFGITGPTNIDPFVCLQNVPVSLCQNQAPVTIGKCSPSATIFINGVDTNILNPANYFPDNIGVILTDTDANGCIGVEQKLVEIKAVPNVNVAGVGPNFGCTSQNNIQLNGFFPAYDASIPENGWTVVTAGVPAGFVTKAGLINPSLLSSNQVVTLRYTAKNPEPNGCSEFKEVTFRVYKNPSAVVLPNTSPISICLGSQYQFTSQDTSSGFTYTWLRNNQSIGFGDTLKASLSGIYTLLVNNNGCLSGPSNQIQLNTESAPVIANIGPDSTLCQTSNIFQIPTPTVLGAFTSSSWQSISPTPANFISSGGVVNPANGLPNGNNLVRFLVSNGNCSDTAFRIFNITTNIDSPIQVSGDLSLCSGDSVLLIAGAQGATFGYEWNRNGQAIIGANNDSLVVYTPGNYQVRIILNGNGQCAVLSSQTVAVTVSPAPVVNIVGEETLRVCYPSQTIDLNVVRPFSPLDATWTGPFNMVSGNGVLTPNNIPRDSTYTLVLSKTIGSCTGQDILKIQAFRFPDATFNASAETICEGGTVDLSYPNPNNYGLTWLRDNSIIFQNQNPITVSQSGNYALIVDNNGCTGNFSRVLNVSPNPDFIMPDPFDTCKNAGFVQLKLKQNNSIGTWQGPGITDPQLGNWNSNEASVPPSGPINITYTGVLGNCSRTDSFKISIDPIPTIDLVVDKPIIEVFGPASITAVSPPGSTFSWSPVATLNITNGPTVAASPEETTRYFVEVTSDKGCKNRKDTLITVDRDFEIYDGFSPNNDRNNDVWVIKNIQRFPEAVVKVFNRWGSLVYESEKGYPEPWDGKYKGNEVPPGAYFYIIDLGEGLTPKSGSLTLIR
jgi:gliding motility-associated-like protein